MTSVVSTRTPAQGTTNIVALRQHMRTALVPWVQFAEPEWVRFASLFHIRSVQDREHILLPGASVDDLVFVCDGLLRAYYLSDDGAESNKAFIAEHEFAGPLPATAVDASVMCGIQALEDDNAAGRAIHGFCGAPGSTSRIWPVSTPINCVAAEPKRGTNAQFVAR